MIRDYESKSRQIIQICKQWKTTERRNEGIKKGRISKKGKEGKKID